MNILTPKLTVIMSTYNETKKELDTSINSILNQTFTNFFFIIIDDNPTSVKLRDYLLKKSSQDGRIRLLFNRHNLGLVKSLNKGIKHTTTELIARMDADDISVKNRFSLQLRFMKSYNLDFVFPNNMNIINNRLDTTGGFIDYKIINQCLLKYFFSHYYNFSMHSGWLIKRRLYIDINGYRDIYSVEDFDFIFRALIHGYRLGYQPDKLMVIKRRFNGISGSSSLIQFISTLVIQYYVKKTKCSEIMPQTLIHNKLAKLITSRAVRKFNEFLKIKHKLKNNFSLFILFKFLCIIFTSKYAVYYLLKVQFIPILNKRISHIVLKRD